MNHRGDQASMPRDCGAPDGSRPLQLGSDPGEPVARMQKLARLLEAFAQETGAARREAARLRSQNATLRHRVDEIQNRLEPSRDRRRRDA